MPGCSMSTTAWSAERRGADRVKPARWPRCSLGATGRNSAAGSYPSVPPSREVRSPADAVTAFACSSRTMTSRTGRSPMLVTIPSDGDDGVAGGGDHSGVTWSIRTWTKGVAAGSPAPARGVVAGVRKPRSHGAVTSRRDSQPRTGPRSRTRSRRINLGPAKSKPPPSAPVTVLLAGSGVAGVPGAGVGLRPSPRRTGRQRRKRLLAVVLQLVDQFVGDFGQAAFVGICQPGRQLPDGTHATSATSTSSSHSSPPARKTAGSGARSCGRGGPRRRTSSRSCRSGASTLPVRPVSSAISRIAVSSAVSPSSMCPLGSDHRVRPRRSTRPISAATRRSSGPPSRPATTSPPAEVSRTVRSRSGPRRAGATLRRTLRCRMAWRRSASARCWIWLRLTPAERHDRGASPGADVVADCSPSDTQAIVAGVARDAPGTLAGSASCGIGRVGARTAGLLSGARSRRVVVTTTAFVARARRTRPGCRAAGRRRGRVEQPRRRPARARRAVRRRRTRAVSGRRFGARRRAAAG